MVRVGTPSAVARPHWYDRNPTIGRGTWAGTVAPHATTVRWSYTVPSGKKALIETVHIGIVRQTAATTPGYAYANIETDGGITLSAELPPSHNAAKDSMFLSIGSALVLTAGQTIRCTTGDPSTGGTIYYFAYMKYTEFDA